MESDASFRVLNPLSAGTLIRLDKAALDQLEVQVREGLQAINNRRGVEVGGLIVGSAVDWNAAEVLITGFIPVTIEYLFGPAFRPSEADIATFKQVAAKADGKAMGYFRSQLRTGAPVRMEDTRLLAELFPSSDCCFLEIHATANTPSSVDLYQVRAESAPLLLEIFALKENQTALAPVEDTNDSAQRQQAEEKRPVEDRNFAAPPSLEISEPSDRKRVVWIIAAAAALAVSLLGAYTFDSWKAGLHSPLAFMRRAQSKAGSASGDAAIGLHMTERGAYVEIRWNPTDPAMATAEKGKLIIADTQGQNIILSRNQLRSGLYLYKPESSPITVLLMISQPDGSFTGDTKEFRSSHPPSLSELPAEVAASTPEPSSELEPVVPRPKPSEPPAAPAPPPVAKRAVAPAPSAPTQTAFIKAAPAQTAATKNASAQTPIKIAPAPITPGPTASKPAGAPAVLEPPSLPSAVSVAAPPFVLQAPLAVPAIGKPAAAPAPTSAPTPAATPVFTTSISPSTPPASHRLLAPRLARQAAPAIPLGVASKIRTEVQLEVGVSVDADGKVTGAHIVSSQGAAAGLLAIEVLKAAQLSRFLPALQDGKPVNGSMVLTFRFSPATN